MPGADDNASAGAAGGEGENKPNGAGNQPDDKAGNQPDDKAKATSFKTVEEAVAEIEKLRKENASRRTTNKTLEERVAASEEVVKKIKQTFGIEEEASPEDAISELQQRNAMLEVELGINRLGIENGIPADQMEFFGFLFSKELNNLKEGEEMSEETISAIVTKAKGVGQQKKSSSGIGNTTPDPNHKGDEVTLEGFSKMNSGERSMLYQKNPSLYQKLFDEANNKRML